MLASHSSKRDTSRAVSRDEKTAARGSLEALEKMLGVVFRKKALLEEAITHRSYLNENPRWRTPHNERLEYLGDAVLELAVTDFLFREFPAYPEGELTAIRSALVNHAMLARVADALRIKKFIQLSRGEAKDEGRARDAILANAVEAAIGAIYCDQGYTPAESFIKKHIIVYLDEVMKQKLFVDSKSELQEIVQEKLKVTPIYKVLEEKGPDHNKRFVAGVFFEKRLVAKGEGFSKQEAERDAAANALKREKWNTPS